MVYFCYIDESGTPQIPGNTSHYVLIGLAIPIDKWKFLEQKISQIKNKYNLLEEENTAWILRRYIEQSKVKNFDKLNYFDRRTEVEKIRKSELLRLQKAQNNKHYKQTRKNFRQTKAYIHLSYKERLSFIEEVADMIGSLNFIRLFGEAIDKIHFDPNKSRMSVDEQGFEQLVSRFEHYLKIRSNTLQRNNNCENNHGKNDVYGILIHDNNETVAKKLTHLMKQFHKYGTLWTSIEKIIETPLFVNSELTSLVQIADLCSYSIRRYLENGETNLFNRIKSRIDRKDHKIVGVRHFTTSACKCELCSS